MERDFPLKRYRLGVDIGGTFTDLVLVDEDAARMFVGKTLTTPKEPAVGVLAGVQELLAAQGFAAAEIAHIIHATTLITNVLVERKGAKAGLITTEGFRDILEIGRELRYDLYDLSMEMPQPLVPRYLRQEVRERLDKDGTVLVPLDIDQLQEKVRWLVGRKGVEAIAVVFLHSFVNSAHEMQAAELIRAAYPEVFVSLSCQVAREIREYERASTTVANAYTQPLAEKYLARLDSELRALGFAGPLYIMLSSGGIGAVRTAREQPVKLVESGPAAGALAGAFYGELAAVSHAVAFDMGGTTAKICLVEESRPTTTYAFEAARVQRFKRGSGLPLRVPTVELIEIGAGGGSIAYIDSLGLMKVGPQSAGADPGPACYGFGGTQPTVTDADLLLGYLNPTYFLGGQMVLDLAAAREAVRRVALPLGMDEAQAAWGIHEIVNENMASAARIHIAEKGRDPRRYTLVATGGAGPVHAGRVAKKLQIRRVLCPLAAGVASTIGLLVAPPQMDLVHSYVAKLDEIDWGILNAIYCDMEAEASALLGEAGVKAPDISWARKADMRYAGQGYEVVVPLPEGRLSAASRLAIEEAFHRVYEDLYGRSTKEIALEGLNWRLSAAGPKPPASFVVPQAPPQAADPFLKGQRQAYFPECGGFVAVPVYDRYALPFHRRALPAGTTFQGPAIVEERESTTVVGPGATFWLDPWGNLIMELEEGA